MKNKRLLKCLSISALASLFVTPIILNSTYKDIVDDKISDVNKQKKLSNDVSYDNEVSTQASTTYNKVDLHSMLVDEQRCAKSLTNNFPTLNSNGPTYQVECNGEWTSGGKFYYAKYFDGLVSGRNYRVTYWVQACGFEDQYISDDEGYEDSCALIFGGTNDPTKRYNGYGDVNTSNMGTIYSVRGLGSEYVGAVNSFNFTAQGSEFNFMAYMKWSTYYSSYKGKYISLTIKLEEEADSVGPVITANKGYSVSLPVGTSERVTEAWIKSNRLFYAYDAVDGDVTDTVQITGFSDTIDYKKTGTYNLVLFYHDKSNNYSSVTLTVVIGDFEKPTYSIKQTLIELECPKTISNDDLLANVTFSDNYDSNVKKTIITNNYNQKTALGTYSVTIRGTDSSGNYTDATFNVKVKDTIAPSVTGIANDSTIRSGTFNISDSGSGIASVTLDGASKTLNNGKLEINGSSYKDGSHTLVVKDNAGNKTEITFTTDNTPPEVIGSIFAEDVDGNKIYYNYLGFKGYAVSCYVDGKKYNLNPRNTDSCDCDFNDLSTGLHTITNVSDSLGNVNPNVYRFYRNPYQDFDFGVSDNEVLMGDTEFTIHCGFGIKELKLNGEYLIQGGKALGNIDYYITTPQSSIEGSKFVLEIDWFANKKTITYYVDNSAPYIVGLSNNDRFNTDKTISFVDSYTKIKSFKLNGELVECETDFVQGTLYKDETFKYTLLGSNLKQGVNTITEITDYLGNVDSTGISFIYDTKAPTITGPSPVETGKHITAQDVLAMFSATDEVDGECSVELVSSTIEDAVGSYVVVLRSTDKTGNSSEISVNVIIKDVDPPIIYVRNDSLVVIKIVEKSELTYENLLSIFKSLYPDKYNYDDENISVNILSNGFNIGTEINKEVGVEVLNSLTGETDTYTMLFSSYSLNPSIDDDKKDDNSDDDKKDDNNDNNDNNDNKQDDSNNESKSWWSKLWSNIVKYVKKAWNWVTGLFKKDNNKPSESVKIIESSSVKKEIDDSISD